MTGEKGQPASCGQRVAGKRGNFWRPQGRAFPVSDQVVSSLCNPRASPSRLFRQLAQRLISQGVARGGVRETAVRPERRFERIAGPSCKFHRLWLQTGTSGAFSHSLSILSLMDLAYLFASSPLPCASRPKKGCLCGANAHPWFDSVHWPQTACGPEGQKL